MLQESIVVFQETGQLVPAMLMDKTSSLGISHWVTHKDDQEFTIYFCGDRAEKTSMIVTSA